MGALSDAEIEQGLRALQGWEREGAAIVRAVDAPDFNAALGLVAEVGRQAEASGHHPDIDIRYTRVVFRLTSHDTGAVTRRDLAMAGRIDTVVAQELPG
ncbi:4a-hydroxytetrahydrobiopterin dehydratase [Murinocardiopsis flavida]|uniref:Putative pterin-4-alpha-carbinolamine dehydratase n=1 Tax=Murinocardiopsis flavida TaxID=645275 RepID=A0A2P8DP64_9ACTN|nr:4a-hydroxytetrahydrobiopterin dehydratase [Murinocardiopsis flavida]PSK98983.1 4a-hydroxytetrahydrobiopterin dehydratase [Murinocardiopsis flavida]